MNEDKVLQARPIAAMAVQVRDVKFDFVSSNGFFLSFKGNKILEFETAQAASSAVTNMNQAVRPVLINILSDFRARINGILNA